MATGAIDYAARAIDMEKIRGQYRKCSCLPLLESLGGRG